ncbi:MAG: sugar transferase [Verrucomicrobiota bacterium]
MLGRKQEINLQLNQIIDSGLIAVSFWFSHWIRFQTDEWFGFQIPTFDNFLWAMFIVVPFTPLVLEMQGFYQNPILKSPWKSLRQIAQALAYVGLAIGLCVIFFRLPAESLARSVLIIFAIVMTVVLLIKERLYQIYLHRRYQEGDLKQPVVLVGLPEDTEALLENMPPEQRMEMDVVERFDISKSSEEELVRVLHDKSVSRVIVAAGHIYFNQVESAVSACELEGVEVWLSADFFQTSIARPNFEMVGSRPMLVFRSTPEFSWALLFKSVFDRVAAAILIVITSPLWLLAYIGIKMNSPGPALFHQKRGGLYGRPFTMFKFRTMDIDAEERRAQLEADNEMSGPVFKIEEDPRIFAFGRFLRQRSIDELPQLVNVLMGQMSLVGPRPLPSYEVSKIEESAQRRRLSVKPGITCLWQVGGRSEIEDFDRWVQLDLDYIDNWSLWLDLKILMKTIPVVFAGSGAR